MPSSIVTLCYVPPFLSSEYLILSCQRPKRDYFSFSSYFFFFLIYILESRKNKKQTKDVEVLRCSNVFEATRAHWDKTKFLYQCTDTTITKRKEIRNNAHEISLDWLFKSTLLFASFFYSIHQSDGLIVHLLVIKHESAFEVVSPFLYVVYTVPIDTQRIYVEYPRILSIPCQFVSTNYFKWISPNFSQ